MVLSVCGFWADYGVRGIQEKADASSGVLCTMKTCLEKVKQKITFLFAEMMSSLLPPPELFFCLQASFWLISIAREKFSLFSHFYSFLSIVFSVD